MQRTAIVNFAHTFCAVAVARVQLKPKHDTRHVRACVHACVRACLCACERARQTIRHQTAHHTRTPLCPSHERPTSNAHLHHTLARRLGTPDWMLHESIKPVTMRRIVMHFHCDTPNKHAHTRAHARTHTQTSPATLCHLIFILCAHAEVKCKHTHALSLCHTLTRARARDRPNVYTSVTLGRMDVQPYTKPVTFGLGVDM